MNVIIKLSLAIGMLLLISFPLQSQLKPFVPENENPWQQLYLLGVTQDSQWIHYKTQNLNGTSVTSIQNLHTGNTLNFEKGVWGSFSDSSKWYVVNKDTGEVTLVELETGKSVTIAHVKTWEFSALSNYFILQTMAGVVQIRNLNTNQMHEAEFINSYAANPAKEVLAVVATEDSGETLRLLDLNTNHQREIGIKPNTTFKMLRWNKRGDTLALLLHTEADNSLQIGLYDLRTKAVHYLQKEQLPNGSSDFGIVDEGLAMDEEGEKVFFYVCEKKSNNVEKAGVEVWDTFDPILYSRRVNNYQDRERPWLHVWTPRDNNVVQVETKDFPNVVFTPNAEYGIRFNPLDYEPQFHLNPFVDLYAINLSNAKQDVIVEKQFTGIGFLSFAPDGNALAYFKNGHWWVYDLPKKTHINLTQGLPVSFQNESSASYHTPAPHGLKGWAKDGKMVYLYDAFDVWRIGIDGKTNQKLTDGRKNNTLFRLVHDQKKDKTNYGYSAFETTSLDDENGLLLSAENKTNYHSGFYRWSTSNHLEEIVFKNKRVRNLYPLSDHSYVLQEESFDAPPAIVKKDMALDKSTTLYQSNKERDTFKWPERKLIYYHTPFADSLKGVLLYPVKYQPEKKYPMIVHIYEMQSPFIHRFLPPNPFNEYGFNFMDYALQDYFVLLPDIVYERNKIGISATQCVESAVDEALQTASIDASRIGLIGHSLGGYETAFIITQTNRFAAAVAGAGIFDLVSFYFGLYAMTGHSEMFRVEQAIWRMQESFFENSAAYLENSPIHHFSNVTTPLLIWTGKQDTNVAPAQSMEGYMALRRLRKKGVLYQYENEDHVLMNIDNQRDLSKRIREWFDGYLK